MTTSTIERFEAIGPRGEACIVLCIATELPDGATRLTHALASGQRLKPTDDPARFETVDGVRVFRLRTGQPMPDGRFSEAAFRGAAAQSRRARPTSRARTVGDGEVTPQKLRQRRAFGVLARASFERQRSQAGFAASRFE